MSASITAMLLYLADCEISKFQPFLSEIYESWIKEMSYEFGSTFNRSY